MLTIPLSRCRIVSDEEMREPTLLAMALAAMAFVGLLGACAVGIVGLPDLGHVWGTSATVGVIETWLALSLRRKPKAALRSLPARQRWFHRISGLGRLSLIGLLACWLGLIVWSAQCRGGPAPPA